MYAGFIVLVLQAIYEESKLFIVEDYSVVKLQLRLSKKKAYIMYKGQSVSNHKTYESVESGSHYPKYSPNYLIWEASWINAAKQSHGLHPRYI